MSRKRIAALLAAGLASLGMLACGGDDDSGTNPPTTGVVSGAVLDDRTLAPVVGATVSLESPPTKGPVAVAAVTTDAYGRFRITDVLPATYDLVVDGAAVNPEAGNPDVHYIRLVLSGVVVGQGSSVVISQPMYMPRIDDTQATEVTGTAPVDVDAPEIAGLTMHLATGAATFPDGTHAGTISIVGVPVDRTPVRLPDHMAPALLFRVVPDGTTFDPPASIVLPNTEQLPGSRTLEILRFGTADGVSTLAIRGRVSLDGQTIQGIAGTGTDGLTAAGLYGTACDAHTVTGHVQGQGGAAIAGARVELLSGTNTINGQRMVVPGATATTDAQGNYSIAGVRLCSVWVRASFSGASGAGVAESPVAILAEEDGTTDAGTLVLELHPDVVAFDIAGTVRYTDGGPAAGIIVQLVGWDMPCPTLAKVPTRGQGSPQRGVVDYGISDGRGAYRIPGVVAPASVTFGLIAFTESGGAPVFGAAQGTTAGAAQNGVTVTVNPTVCTTSELYATCAVGSWSLSATRLTLTPAPLSVQCGTDFGTGSIQVAVQSLENGIATIEVEETLDCVPSSHLEIFDRAIEGGPSVLTAANLAGIYWRTGQDPVDPQAGDMVVAFLGNGTFVLFEADGNDLEAGTYAAAGGTLSVHPVFSSGEVTADRDYEYSVLGNTLTVQQGQDTIVFGRCPGTSGTGLPGAWTSYDEELGEITQVVIGAGEYAVATLGTVVALRGAADGASTAAARQRWTSLDRRLRLAQLGLVGTR